MAVRFLPTPDPAADAPVSPERADLAEVIDLRSRLGRQTAAPEAPLDAAGTSLDISEASLDAPEAPPEVAEACRSVTEDGVRLLARRARSSGELRRELLRLGHEAHEVESVILDFDGSLYLDDLGLARITAESLRERKRASRMQIRLKLKERLLPDGIIEQVLGELDDDAEDELLRTAASDRARRMVGLDRQTAERRLLGFLARRGWSGERAVRVAREALDATAARGTVRFR